jgi:hypothetical protein
MDKPDWSEAPEWAMFLAMDDGGQWCWFVSEPIRGAYHWMPTADRGANGYGDYFDDVVGDFSSDFEWTSTLESRT